MYQIKAIPEDFVVEEIPSRSWTKTGEYTVFKIIKREANSEEVASLLAKLLHLPRRLVNYAGTKDYHAITTQYYSVKGKHAAPKLDHITIEHVGYTDQPLSLGSLQGNRFVITVRNLATPPNPTTIVPNYFDEQRFSINNDQVGKCFVKGDFAKACELIITAGGYVAAQVKDFLEEQPTNPIGALGLVPKKILTLYIHAYQSRLFNNMLKHILVHIPLQQLFEKQIELPLIGFGTERPQEEVLAKAYDQVMQEEGLTERDFIIRKLPAVASEGQLRKAAIKIEDVCIGELSNDERNPGKKKCVVSFTLTKGAYATNVIKELFS